MSSSDFNSVLLEISNELSDENLEKLKFLLRDVIGRQKLEKVRAGHQLFEALAQRGKLGEDNTDLVSQLLTQIYRHDLAHKLINLEVQVRIPCRDLSDTERDKLDIAVEMIRENLGRNWRKLGRKLRLSEVKLDSISTRHPTDLEETTMELLKEWKKSRGAGAQTDELIEALRGCQLNLTADKILDRFSKQEITS